MRSLVSVFHIAMDDPVKELQIIYLDKENHTISLNEELLEKILLSEEVKDSKVMVLSVAGAFRQGKSFLLNFFIKYLKAVESGGSQVSNNNLIMMLMIM